jgi:hypothetical protein
VCIVHAPKNAGELAVCMADGGAKARAAGGTYKASFSSMNRRIMEMSSGPVVLAARLETGEAIPRAGRSLPFPPEALLECLSSRESKSAAEAVGAGRS